MLDIKFDANSPPLLLGKRQYAPTNSQNTLFHYDAFWTLVMPRNVTFREVDILRGYIAIRMLYEIDRGGVAFMAPNAVQVRNAHSYHKDYLQEKRLYEKIATFVADLDEWVCNGSSNSLKECFLQCIVMLVVKKHLDSSEIELYRRWIKDLDSIGYRWPHRRTNNKSPDESSRTNINSRVIYYKSVEQDHSSNSNQNEKSLVQRRAEMAKKKALKQICESLSMDDLNMNENKNKIITDVILVTWIKSREEFEIVVNIVGLHFQNIIGCFTTTNTLAQILSDKRPGGMTLIDGIGSFDECVFHATRLGHRQNTFIFVKYIYSFEFWSDKLTLEEPVMSNAYLRMSKRNTYQKSLFVNIFFLFVSNYNNCKHSHVLDLARNIINVISTEMMWNDKGTRNHNF